MQRHMLMLCFTIAATAALSGRAQAQLATCPPPKVIAPTCNLPGYGLSLADQRTANGKLVTDCCRKYIADSFSSAVAGKTHETVAMADGSLVSGVREPYTAAVKLSASDGTFFSTINQARLASHSTFVSIHPPAWDDAGIDSCSEYAYKQYYEAIRATDSLTGYGSNYESAYSFIMNGIPFLRMLPVAGRQLTDFDGRPLYDEYDRVTGNFLPQHVTTSMNGFHWAPFAFMKSVAPAGKADELATAIAAAKAAALPLDTTDWAFAAQMHANPDVAQLSPSERDFIANRLSQLADASNQFSNSFDNCVLETFRSQASATAASLSDATLAKYAAALVQAKIDGGVTDPSALQIYEQLSNPTTRAKVLSDLATVEANKGVLGDALAKRFYSTSSGAMLSRLAYLDAPTMTHSLDAITNYGSSFTGPSCNRAFSGLARAAELMVQEWEMVDHGCLGTSQKCEWSVPLFVRNVTARARDAERDSDRHHKVCSALLGENFTSSVTISPADRSSLTNFDNRVKAVYTTALHDSHSAPRTTQARGLNQSPGVGRHQTGGTTWGDSDFGAGYDYDLDWGVTVAERTTDGQICRLDGRVQVQLDAHATMWNHSKPLVNGHVIADSAAGGSLDAKLSVGGNDLYNPGVQSLDQPINLDQIDHTKLQLFHDTIVIVFVPIFIDAGVSFDYGYGMQASLKKAVCDPKNPSITLSASAGPRAGASAYVSAGVDLFLVSVGIECDLTLIDASLPLTVTLSTSYDPTDASVHFGVDATLKLILQELAGRLSLVIKVLEISVYDKTLFSWDGLKQTLPLWKDSLSYPLGTLDAPSLPSTL